MCESQSSSLKTTELIPVNLSRKGIYNNIVGGWEISQRDQIIKPTGRIAKNLVPQSSHRAMPRKMPPVALDTDLGAPTAQSVDT